MHGLEDREFPEDVPKALVAPVTAARVTIAVGADVGSWPGHGASVLAAAASGCS
jgi:hypothetical protein